MKVHDFEDEIRPWALRNFPDDTTVDTVLGMVEEAGEVARAALKRKQGIRGSPEQWTAEIRKECADVFIKLCHIAVVEGFDLEEAIRARWGAVALRDWVKDKAAGGQQGGHQG